PPAGGAITSSLPRFARSTSFDLAWAGATDSGSGVATYDVYGMRAPYSGGFGAGSVFKTTAGPDSATFTGLSGSTYCFFTVVTDTVGNSSLPSAQRCTALPVDDGALSGAGWKKRSGQFGYYRGTYKQSSAKGATLALAGVEAKRISLVAVVCPGCGAVSVFQGKKLLKRVNLAASTVQHRIIPIAAFGGAHTGKVTVTVTSSGRPVLVDGLGISRV
ncbi:MAG TPA: hypothetical protein VJU01_07655, partial [Gaiellaceae bacterium]|nr:hypothetical protein [Gaiellaceae bacterium]